LKYVHLLVKDCIATKLITVSFWYEKYKLPLYLSCFSVMFNMLVFGWEDINQKLSFSVVLNISTLSRLPSKLVVEWFSSISGRIPNSRRPPVSRNGRVRIGFSFNFYLQTFGGKRKVWKKAYHTHQSHFHGNLKVCLTLTWKKCPNKSQQTLYKNITFSNVQQSLNIQYVSPST